MTKRKRRRRSTMANSWIERRHRRKQESSWASRGLVAILRQGEVDELCTRQRRRERGLGYSTDGEMLWRPTMARWQKSLGWWRMREMEGVRDLGWAKEVMQRLYLALYRSGRGRRIDGRGQWPSMAMGR
jgi:hypothetical protein